MHGFDGFPKAVPHGFAAPAPGGNIAGKPASQSQARRTIQKNAETEKPPDLRTAQEPQAIDEHNSLRTENP